MQRGGGWGREWSGGEERDEVSPGAGQLGLQGRYLATDDVDQAGGRAKDVVDGPDVLVLGAGGGHVVEVHG